MKSHDEHLLSQWAEQSGGANLEYDARFLALQQAATERPEQQFGNTIIEAQAPEWAQVLKQADELLLETADLRVLLLRVWAQVERQGLEAYADGLDVLLHMFESLWDVVHPRLDQEGEHDPFPRMNALGAFVDMQGLFKAVRASALLRDQHGFLSLRDAESVLEGSRPELFAGGPLRLQELLKQARRDPDSPMSMLLRVEQRLQAVHELMVDKLGGEWAPDFSPVLLSIRTVTERVEREDSHTEAVVDEEQGAASDKEQSAPVPTSTKVEAPMQWQSVALNNRADAMLMLEKVCSYFETHEPSHPAPILLKRVQQTIPMSFPEILQNLIPSGADQFDIWMPK